MEVLELGVVYDQLSITNLASFEAVARRVQLLEVAYFANPKHPRFEGSEHLEGRGRKGAAVAPELLAYAAEQVKAEAHGDAWVPSAVDSLAGCKRMYDATLKPNTCIR